MSEVTYPKKQRAARVCTEEEFIQWMSTSGRTDLKYLGGFEGMRKKARFLCTKRNHEILKVPSDVKQGVGCAECNGGRFVRTKEMYNNRLEEYKSSVRLIEEFDPKKAKHKFCCLEKNHEFYAGVAGVMQRSKQGKGHCVICAETFQKTTQYVIEKLKFLGRDDIIVLGEYINAYTPMLFGCHFGHQWMTYANCILKDETTCPYCSHHIAYTTETYKKAMLEWGRTDIILADEYINVETKVAFLCTKNPKHGTSLLYPFNVQQGQGCKKCTDDHRYFGQRMTGESIQEIFHLQDIPLQKTVKHESCPQELAFIDFSFFVDGKEIFVEFNGEQHYKSVKLWGGKKQLKKQVARDTWLREVYCPMFKIILIEVDGRKFYNKKKITKFLLSEFTRLNIPIPTMIPKPTPEPAPLASTTLLPPATASPVHKE